MERYSTFYRRTFVVATVVILGYAALRILEPFWGALEWAIVLAFLLYPLQVRLTRFVRGRAALSAGVLTALSPIVVIAPLSMLAIAFAQQVRNLVQYLKSSAAVPMPHRVAELNHYPIVGPVLGWIRHNTPVTTQQVQDWLVESTRSVLQGAASLSGNVALGVAGTLVGFLLMSFLLFFLLRDGAAILGTAERLIPLDPVPRRRLIEHVISVLRAVFYGTVTTALIEGALIGCAFALVELPSPVVFGVLAAAAAFIPVTGSLTVLVPAVLYVAAVGRWGATAFLLICTIVIAIGDQLLRPLLASRHGGVPTLVMFLGAIGGVSTFGIVGLLLGPVLLSLVVALLQLADDGVPPEQSAERADAASRPPHA